MSPQPTGTDPREVEPPVDAPDRTRAIQMMIAGAIVAVLAPLGGFLGGTMVGTSSRMGEFDAMFLWLFAGLVVGGLGAVLVLLGLLKWVRVTRS